ncbi:MAG: polysaccharide deacetylase family protein [Thermoleophilaceae bacterium]
MPSFGEELARQERWARLPGIERATRPGTAVLSFDDGPDPDGTPAVLEVLDAAGVRATFFLLGEQLMKNPRLGGEISRAGHEIALHGFGHTGHDELRDQAARDDLARGLGTVEAACGRRPRFYRPPYGVFSEASHAACADLGLEPVYWSAWGADWESIDAARIADLVVRDLVEGTIVVLHDSARYAHRDSAAPTAGAVPLIAAAAGESGLELLPLGEALG